MYKFEEGVHMSYYAERRPETTMIPGSRSHVFHWPGISDGKPLAFYQ